MLAQGTKGNGFRTSTGERQGCLLSTNLFNIFAERITTEAREDHIGSLSIGGQVITNLRFANDIDGLAGTEGELAEQVTRIYQTSSKCGIELNTEKTKIIVSGDTIAPDITIRGHKLETVNQFKYLGSIIKDEGSRAEILSRAAQATSALAQLRQIWKDKNIYMKSKIMLKHALVFSIFLEACGTWTLTVGLQRKITAVEMRCYR